MSNDHILLPRFIVFEGLDGSGKSTQAALLADQLRHAGHPVWLTAEPTEQAIGRHIRAILGGEFRVHPQTMALLYAADRCEHLYQADSGIVARCTQSDQWVVCCRYLFSSLAYQGAIYDEQCVADLNRRFPLPEHLIYLDLSPQESKRRRASRSTEDIFEARLQFQTTVYERYQRIVAAYAGTGMQIHTISAAQGVDAVADEIWRHMPILKM